MAFQKNFTRRGVPCSYIRVNYAPANYATKEISAHFAIYFSADAARADPANPVDPIFAKLRLSGAKFDQYLSSAALAQVQADDPFRAALYAAAKVEPVICDYPPAQNQATVFADATDV